MSRHENPELISLSFDDVPLSFALKMTARKLGGQLVIDRELDPVWPTLRHYRVTTSLKNVDVDQALEKVGNDEPGTRNEVDYEDRIHCRVYRIGRDLHVGRMRRYVVVYDVRDIRQKLTDAKTFVRKFDGSTSWDKGKFVPADIDDLDEMVHSAVEAVLPYPSGPIDDEFHVGGGVVMAFTTATGHRRLRELLFNLRSAMGQLDAKPHDKSNH